jgi:diguanylate cyclase (GGDEF)-like protein/PAS domain S-box-containing protein
MIKAAKKRGYVTMDELNSVLPSEEVTSEQIEDTMAMLSDMGINVVEDEEAEDAAGGDDDGESDSDGEESEGGELAPTSGTALATAKKKEPTDRTDDPVRMYLREMGSVELLSREGEIAIAKRIEAGRETMIAGLCESPLTFQALIIWRDELNEGTTLLREIIDLETTYSGPEAKAAPQFQSPEKIEADRKAAEEKEKTRKARMTAANDDDITSVGGEGMILEEEEEDDDESSLSLAAMEAELRPQVMETLDTIADTYKKLRKLQDQQVEQRLAATGTLSSAQERRYKELKDELITAVKSLSLNQNRVDSLVEQLYDISKRLMQNEGRLLRLAESYVLARQLRRLGLDAAVAPDAAGWQALLERVSRVYEEHDKERYLMERSQDMAAEEMAALYGVLRSERDQLDSRVRERTEALRLSESRLSSLLSLSADWIWEQDADLRFTYFSEGMEAATGLSPFDLLGRQRQTDGATVAAPEELARFNACVQARRAFRDFTYGLQRPDGVRRFIRISGEPVFDEGGSFLGYRGVGRDVTETALAELRVQELARIDSLTGLPNRNMFFGELDRAVARARRHQRRFGVCFIDLDGFKGINDNLGHEAGDEVLKLMAQRLRGAVRASDMVARLGGDEFVVLLEGAASDAEADCVAEKILAAVSEPLALRGCRFDLTCSMGVGLYPVDGEDAAALVRNADAAMYLAKQRGKNMVQHYTSELADSAARLFALETELRQAVPRGELRLHFQPKIDIDSGRMHSVEALVRWMHPQRGLLPPAEFIGLAEERGLIVPIGRWVIETACQQIRDWREAGLVVPAVAVNLSARQFASDSLADDIERALQANGVDPTQFEVELTESVLMADPDRASAVLQRLDAKGVRISIDDFGTGYSSLSHLKRFPARTVKIDRSFVSGLPHDKNDAAITQAVIAMAHSLGLMVVAEGVETDAQLQALRGLRCDEAQGFLLGRPMAADELGRRLPRVAATPALI